MPSLLSRRPGYFASAYAFWGIQNREASLRFIPETALVPASAANAELKASDASGNPYLTLAALIRPVIRVFVGGRIFSRSSSSCFRFAATRDDAARIKKIGIRMMRDEVKAGRSAQRP